MENSKLYPIVVLPLSDEDGGGFVARVPDLPGCYGDGPTPEAALRDATKAIAEWVDEYARMGRSVPAPGSAASQMRRDREEELKFLVGCVQRLRESEKAWDDLDGRIATIETEILRLADMVENSEGWERFHIITKAPRRSLAALLC